jgi:phage protein D
MTMTDTTSSQCDVQVDGAPLEPTVFGRLVSAEVDSSIFAPARFRLVFRATPAEVLEPAKLQLATDVVISVSSGGVPTPLITAEVTAVEVDYAPDGALTVVRGMDKSHRMMRGTRTRAYPEMLASEVVAKLLAGAGLRAGRLVPTAHVYEWLSQANVSDWVFVQQLAALENRVAYADAEGLFNFVPITDPRTGPPPVLDAFERPRGNQLAMGDNLVRLRACVTSAEQVPEVTVLGYDPATAEPVVAPSPGKPSTSMSVDPGTLPAVVAGEFAATAFVDVSRPFDSEATANNRAGAIAARIAGALGEMEGECLGNPALHAGEAISVGLAGLPFDGQYVLSSARHVFAPESGGYTTWFTVGGLEDRSLLALGSGGAHAAAARPSIGGLVIGKVSDNVDEQELGRVKVTFPWLSPEYVSSWARTVQIGASKEGAGFVWVPEVGDEVLVGFDRGEVDHPYVLGNLYNGVFKPEPAPQVGGGAVASRRITSRARHTVQFDDGPEAMGITITTGDKSCTIKLDAEEQSIELTSLGRVSIKAGGEGLSIDSEGDVSIAAVGTLSLQGATVSARADASVSVQGADVALSGDASVSVMAAEISLGA